MGLATLVVGQADGRVAPGGRVSFDRPFQLLDRVGVRAVQPQQLAAVGRTLTGVGDEPRLGVAPRGQRAGPRAGATEVGDLLAGASIVEQ